MADPTDTEHWLDLIEKTKRRMHALQLQKAQLGFATPPHISNEIEECYRDIELYRAQLTVGPPPSQKAQDEVPGDAQQVLIEAQLKQIRDENAAANTSVIETVGKIQEKVEGIAEKAHAIDLKTEEYRAETAAYRQADNEFRQERQRDNDKRFTALEGMTETLIAMVSRSNDRNDWTQWRIVVIVIGAQVLTVAIVYWITHGS